MKKLANVETDQNVEAFIAGVTNKKRRSDAKFLVQFIEEIKGIPPKIWGVSIVGFGKYTYQRKNGESYEWFHVGFSPARAHTTVYVMYDINQEKELLEQLGEHKTGKGCLYIKSLDKINLEVLKKLVEKSDRW